jgi:hypothetical protein
MVAQQGAPLGMICIKYFPILTEAVPWVLSTR